MKNKKLLLTFSLFLSISALSSQTVFSDYHKMYKGHKTTVNEVVFSKDGSKLYSCGGNNQILVFDVKTSQIIKRTEALGFEKPINHISLSHNDKLLAWASFNGNKITVLNAEDFEKLIEIKGFSSIEDLEFSPRTNNIAIVGYNANEKQILSSFDTETGLEHINYFTQEDESLPICVGYSPDSEMIACGICNFNQGVWIYDANSGELKQTISSDDDINMVQFSPDNKLIAGACSNGNVYIWKVEDGQLVHTLKGLKGIVTTIDFNPDGKSIVGAGFDNTCTFKSWNTKTGELIQTVGDKGPQIMCVTHNPKGDALAVAYRTYGDLFDVPTINIFYTEIASLQIEWFKIDSSENGLVIEFPEKPELKINSDKYYKYYVYTLQLPGKSYMVSAVEYLYEVDDAKRKQAIDKKAQNFESSKTNISTLNYSLKSFYSFEKIGYKDKLRYHQRVVFVNNIMYTVFYSDYKKEISSEEERFFNSFSVK